LFYPGAPISNLGLSRSFPTRPEIPIAATEPGADVFVASKGWADWIVETLVSFDGAFHNPDHQHLESRGSHRSISLCRRQLLLAIP
jgi:hypothetical protein